MKLAETELRAVEARLRATEMMSVHDLAMIGNLLDTVRHLQSLLRHSAQRNHEPSPKSCTPCEQIESVLAGG